MKFNFSSVKFLIIAGVSSLVFACMAGVLVPNVANAGDCGTDVDTSILGSICKDTGNGGDDVESSGIWQILTGVLNIMVVGVGVLAVAGIVYGAILYTTAGDNQQQVEQAMSLFRNVVIGLVTFALMWALLEFLIPGGILG